MKTKFIGATALSLFLITQSCKQTQDVVATQDETQVSSSETISIEEAKSIYENYTLNPTSGRVGEKKFEKKPQWDYAQKEKFTDGREVIIAPISSDVKDYEYAVTSTSDISKKTKTLPEVFTTHKVVVYKDKGKDKVELMSVIGEESYKSKYTYFDYDKEFTGILQFSTMDGDFLRGFYYDKGKRIGIVEEKPKNAKNGKLNACYVIQTISVFYYYVTIGNYQSSPNPNGDIRLTYQVVCDDAPAGIYLTPSTYNAGGGSSVTSASGWMANLYQRKAMFEQLYTFQTTDLPVIANEHLKCFTNTSSNCTVTLNIDQPIDGTASPLNPNPFTQHLVGHAFLTFQQVLPNGTVFRASIGFYPKSGGTPFQPSGDPKFVDDGNYSATPDVRTTFNVTPSELMTMVNYVQSYNSGNYNLANRNCGNMCVDAFGQIGVGLPTGWMNTFWYSSTPTGSNYNSEVRGPSIGAFGEQMKSYSNSKITNTDSSTSKSGNCN